jgi:hypothetical protein
MTDLTYCVLDLSLPCIIGDDGNAWFYSDGAWRWVASGDPIHNGKEIDAVTFRAKFPNLPPLPKD